ncbi:MAG: hypothetical protein HY866_03045 [Chloroflexi bacterium]|nr:hypothetical protein [Chloroflexota bacterium]
MRSKPSWMRCGIISLLSVVALLAALEIGFRLMPQTIPLGACRSSLTLAHAFCHYEYQYDQPLRLGYLFKPGYQFAGDWNPADPAQINQADQTCGPSPDHTFRYAFRTDDHGFVGNATPWQDQYDIVITGDSFSRSFAPVWWQDLLREQTGLSVLNLGMDGWATLSEVEAVRQYGLDKHPRWVLLLYFEGNDLFGVEEYQRRRESGLDWRSYQLQQVGSFERLIVPHLIGYAGQEIKQFLQPDPKVCRYPMTIATNVNRFPTIFYNVHISQLSASRDEIVASRAWTLATQAILDLRAEVTAQGGRFLLVYVPAKEHLYWSRIWEERDIGHFLEITTPMRSYYQFSNNVDDQMLMMIEFAAANRLEFLNLTEDLWWRTVVDGREYYNYADMHWNAEGNRLVADLITRYIAQIDGPLSR